jgi:ankyrin repeat protein
LALGGFVLLQHGNTILHLAARHGHVDIINFIAALPDAEYVKKFIIRSENSVSVLLLRCF